MPKFIKKHILLILAILVIIAAVLYMYAQMTQKMLLLVVQADSGVVTKETLTLQNPDKNLVWFADRPDRAAGRVALSEAVSKWNDVGFGKVPPNAALTIDKKTVVVTLSNPVYDAEKDLLVFNISQVGESNINLSKPVIFEDASLFIDSASSEVQVLNGLSIGAITANVYRDGNLLATKTN